MRDEIAHNLEHRWDLIFTDPQIHNNTTNQDNKSSAIFHATTLGIT